MPRMAKSNISYFLLGFLTCAAISAAAFSHLVPSLHGLRSLVTPLCVLTALAALMVGRITRRRHV